jgi:hypothetical protein
MGFSLPFGKKRKIRKLIEKYLKDNVREERTFNEQRKRLDSQLDDRQIDQQIYERYRVILEKQYYQKQKKEWVKVKNKFQNLLNS